MRKKKSYKARHTLNTRDMTIYLYIHTEKHIFHDRTHTTPYTYINLHLIIQGLQYLAYTPQSILFFTLQKNIKNICRNHTSEKQKNKIIYKHKTKTNTKPGAKLSNISSPDKQSSITFFTQKVGAVENMYYIT